MVDTLAPKRIFTQRDLDKSLTPSPVVESIMAPSKNVLSAAPKDKKVGTLLQTDQPDYTINKEEFFNRMANALKSDQSIAQEQEQTVKSSQETQDVKQTGGQVQKDVPQGLVMKPVEYAADGFNDKGMSGPILVGEQGAELVVPTGRGKLSILDAATTAGLMVAPSGIGGAKNIGKAPTHETIKGADDKDLDITYQYTDRPSESIEQRRIYDEETGSVIGFAPPGEYGGITNAAKNIKPTSDDKADIISKEYEKRMNKAKAVSLMTSDDAYTNFTLEDFLLGKEKFGIKDHNVSKAALDKFIDNVWRAESSRGKNIIGEGEHKAMGDFQFKTLDHLDKDGNIILDENGIPKNSSFKTALTRTKNIYELKGLTVPYYIEEGLKHNDPTKLSFLEQKEIMLANLYERKDTDELIRKMLSGDKQAGFELYAKHHHTGSGIMDNKRLQRIFLAPGHKERRAEQSNDSIMGKPVKKAQEGMRNVDIGEPQKAGWLDFLFPRLQDKEEPGRGVESHGSSGQEEELVVSPDPEKKEPFDPTKIRKQDWDPSEGGYGIDLDYFYDNLDEMAEYSISQKKGQDYVPSQEELREERKDLRYRFDAWWDMQTQMFDDEDIEWAKQQYMEPDSGYIGDAEEREELLKKHGPGILPTT